MQRSVRLREETAWGFTWFNGDEGVVCSGWLPHDLVWALSDADVVRVGHAHTGDLCASWTFVDAAGTPMNVCAITAHCVGSSRPLIAVALSSPSPDQPCQVWLLHAGTGQVVHKLLLLDMSEDALALALVDGPTRAPLAHHSEWEHGCIALATHSSVHLVQLPQPGTVVEHHCYASRPSNEEHCLDRFPLPDAPEAAHPVALHWLGSLRALAVLRHDGSTLLHHLGDEHAFAATFLIRDTHAPHSSNDTLVHHVPSLSGLPGALGYLLVATRGHLVCHHLFTSTITTSSVSSSPWLRTDDARGHRVSLVPARDEAPSPRPLAMACRDNQLMVVAGVDARGGPWAHVVPVPLTRHTQALPLPVHAAPRPEPVLGARISWLHGLPLRGPAGNPLLHASARLSWASPSAVVRDTFEGDARHVVTALLLRGPDVFYGSSPQQLLTAAQAAGLQVSGVATEALERMWSLCMPDESASLEQLALVPLLCHYVMQRDDRGDFVLASMGSLLQWTLEPLQRMLAAAHKPAYDALQERSETRLQRMFAHWGDVYALLEVIMRRATLSTEHTSAASMAHLARSLSRVLHVSQLVESMLWWVRHAHTLDALPLVDLAHRVSLRRRARLATGDFLFADTVWGVAYPPATVAEAFRRLWPLEGAEGAPARPHVALAFLVADLQALAERRRVPHAHQLSPSLQGHLALHPSVGPTVRALRDLDAAKEVPRGDGEAAPVLHLELGRHACAALVAVAQRQCLSAHTSAADALDAHDGEQDAEEDGGDAYADVVAPQLVLRAIMALPAHADALRFIQVTSMVSRVLQPIQPSGSADDAEDDQMRDVSDDGDDNDDDDDDDEEMRSRGVTCHLIMECFLRNQLPHKAFHFLLDLESFVELHGAAASALGVRDLSHMFLSYCMRSHTSLLVELPLTPSLEQLLRRECLEGAAACADVWALYLLARGRTAEALAVVTDHDAASPVKGIVLAHHNLQPQSKWMTTSGLTPASLLGPPPPLGTPAKGVSVRDDVQQQQQQQHPQRPQSHVSGIRHQRHLRNTPSTPSTPWGQRTPIAQPAQPHFPVRSMFDDQRA